MERNKNIEALRAIAISYMLLYHYSNSITGIVTGNNSFLLVDSFGQFALVGFFVLSGFGTYLSFQRLELNGEIKFMPYMKRRLRAILPQYYFCVGVILLFTTSVSYLSTSHLYHVLESLFLVQNYDINNAINGVTWTLAVLFQLYLVSIPLYKLSKKYGFWSWGIGLVFSICLKRLLFWYISLNELNKLYYVVASIRIPMTTIDLILIGMCSAQFCVHVKANTLRFLKQKRIVCLCFSIVLLYHFIFAKYATWIGNLYDNRWMSCIWQSIIGGFVAGLCILLYFLPFNYQSVGGKVIQFIAKYEYGIYLWHMILIGNFMIFQPDWYIWLQDNVPYGLMVIMLILAVSVGWISTKLTSSQSYRKLYKWLE